MPWEVSLVDVYLDCFVRRLQGLLLLVRRRIFRLDLLGALVLARPHLSWVLCGADPYWKGYFSQHRTGFLHEGFGNLIETDRRNSFDPVPIHNREGWDGGYEWC